jgi:hypothetical protein
LPRPRWHITSAGPVGTTHLLALVVDAPRDFASLGMKPAGPFSVLEANRTAARDIQLVTACDEPGASRNLAVGQRCSSAYGAALVAIEEREANAGGAEVQPRLIWGLLLRYAAGEVLSAFAQWLIAKARGGIAELREKRDTTGGAVIAREPAAAALSARQAAPVTLEKPAEPL